ncbi:hypothetical protein [Luteimonas vadosa]|uniref:Uncharacterized protein n=1 Tax=Luteimonas vadosa TaxID=1165507 RepID=A0ABP9DU53_9GAMM
MATRYYIRIPDAEQAQAAGEFGFRSRGAEGLAAELQDALRSDALFQRWRATQDDPDAVDPSMGATDPDATVLGEPDDLHADLIVTTTLPGGLFKHRLRLLAGNTWQLRDVSAA